MKKAFSLLLLGLALGVAPLPGAAEADTLAPLVQVLKSADDPQLQLDILKGMSAGLKGRRNVPMPAGWEEVAARLAKSPEASVRELTQSLSLTFGSAGAMASLREQLKDAGASVTVRSNALQSLVAAKDPQLVTLLKPLLNDAALRSPALRGLAVTDDASVPPAILAAYPAFNTAERKDALGTLTARATFARALLDAVGKGTVPSKDLSADLVRQLRNLNDAAVIEQVQKVWGVQRESDADRLKELARFKAMIQKGPPGDPSRGRAVFSKTCQQCHTLFGTGGNVGPDITGSNRADLDYVLHNVLDPNAEIPNDYRTTNLETKDDRLITGVVKFQDANAVTIATPNEAITVPRSDIQSLRQGEISMMPEGLLQAFTEAEVRDLIAYLASKAQVPLPAP